MHNLFDISKLDSTAEQSLLLLQQGGLRLEHIVSFGHATPADFWYDQSQDEWVCLLQGQALLQFDDGSKLPLKSGDSLLIKAHRRHRVASVSPDALWLALFLP